MQTIDSYQIIDPDTETARDGAELAAQIARGLEDPECELFGLTRAEAAMALKALKGE